MPNPATGSFIIPYFHPVAQRTASLRRSGLSRTTGWPDDQRPSPKVRLPFAILVAKRIKRANPTDCVATHRKLAYGIHLQGYLHWSAV